MQALTRRSISCAAGWLHEGLTEVLPILGRSFLDAAMPHGLPRKIRLAFLLQVALASLALVLAGYLVSFVIKYSLVRTVLADEAVHFWQMQKSVPDNRPPIRATSRAIFRPPVPPPRRLRPRCATCLRVSAKWLPPMRWCMSINVRRGGCIWCFRARARRI
ncbi:hypothetical protein XAC2852_160073 [Xanthomonas citri pv. citri]|nr:hypothetical protein XAC2852_160073 [Xanthomonas citri pv. citri]CEI02515.1 hypothetical protein XACB100_420022 [Xanthomonas citri pv. citri]